MKKLFLLTVLTMVISAFGTTPVLAKPKPVAKVTVCHVPPDDPTNFQTIIIGTDAVADHLTHGDLLGRCDANLEKLCDDGNACTIDVENGACSVTHPPVNCDDGNECTTDTCDPQNGCVSTAKNCNDGNECTTDICNPTNGACEHTDVVCDVYCDPGSGCTDPCATVSCAPVGCYAGMCTVDALGQASCGSGAPLPADTPCDDNDLSTFNDVCDGAGTCSGTACSDTCGGGAPYCDGQGCTLDGIYSGTCTNSTCVPDDLTTYCTDNACSPSLCEQQGCTLDGSYSGTCSNSTCIPDDFNTYCTAISCGDSVCDQQGCTLDGIYSGTCSNSTCVPDDLTTYCTDNACSPSLCEQQSCTLDGSYSGTCSGSTCVPDDFNTYCTANSCGPSVCEQQSCTLDGTFSGTCTASACIPDNLDDYCNAAGCGPVFCDGRSCSNGSGMCVLGLCNTNT